MSAASFIPAFTFGVGSPSGGSSIFTIDTGLGDVSTLRRETASLTFQPYATLSCGLTAETRSDGPFFSESTDIGGQYTISVQEVTDLTNAYVKDGVYRFFYTYTGTHFYSASWNER